MPEIFRIYHPKTNKFRTIEAKNGRHAVEICGWKYEDCEIRVKTNNGGGGWKKYKE